MAAPKPVPAIADHTIAVREGVDLPLYLSRDWSAPLPDIERVVIIQHGLNRNASSYFQAALTAQAAAGDIGRHALMIAPQFIDQLDADTFHVPGTVLRFTPGGWESGGRALAPQPVSSFEAYDVILARLADKRLFPNLKQVVIAGHSGGAQLVQRYAIVGRGEAALIRAGIALHYVVANPSSYAYFSTDRPEPQIAATCSGYNRWKYGLEHLTAYADQRTPAELEQGYVSRRVIYLLGSLDTNPNHPQLDKSCMGEAQGPTRWARGHSYSAYMKARNADTPNHVLYEIPGVGHNGGKMFTSACGIRTLFDTGPCN